ncbi:hypothetical protein J6497_00295 [Bradyrhizobium sp. CNPSo 4026]|nr:hypothetical protein [Bradyrhizobium cenepequi]
MLYVEHAMLRRIPKASARWYSDLIAAIRRTRIGTGWRLTDVAAAKGQSGRHSRTDAARQERRQ